MLGLVVGLLSRVSRRTVHIGYERGEIDGEQAIYDFMKSRYFVSSGGTAPRFCKFHEQGALPLPLLAAHLCMWYATGGRQEVLAPPAMELSSERLLTE